VDIAPLQPSNCGFDVAAPDGWSAYFRSRFAGQPMKNVAIAFEGVHQPGEFVVTDTGIEGSLVYAVSGPVRDATARLAFAVDPSEESPRHRRREGRAAARAAAARGLCRCVARGRGDQVAAARTGP